MNTTTPGWIIAGPNAIYAIGPTTAQCYAEYVNDTGDDSRTVDDLLDASTDSMHMRPATDRLLAYVDAYGGAIVWRYVNKVADLVEEES